MQVLPVAGGWNKVVDLFGRVYAGEMERRPGRFMILLIDCDRNLDRIGKVKARIPQQLGDRVFVLGVLTEPEYLKPDLGPLETIGSAMAQDCREGTRTTWAHKLLRHNTAELDRLYDQVRPLLFGSPPGQ